MRRGSGGGLFIASPTPDNVVTTAVKYLVRMKLGPTHYIEVRAAVEGRAAELAAERLDDEGAAQLVRTHEQLVKAAAKDVAAAASLLHILIGQLSGNRALSLFLQILTSMTAKNMVWRRRSVQRAYDIVMETHPAIVDAILARNPARAREAMLAHVDRAIRFFR
jgi:DNA-binding FadR family transcriptional regulator